MRFSYAAIIAVVTSCLVSPTRAEQTEARPALSLQTARALLRGQDATDLDRAEFDQAISFLNAKGRSTLLSVFLTFDFDGDGVITDLEIATHEKYDHRGRSNKILDRIRAFGDTPIRYGKISELAEEEVRSQGGWRDADALFALYDRNGDMRITRPELARYVQVSRSQSKARDIVRQVETAAVRDELRILLRALRIAKMSGESISESGMTQAMFARKVRRHNTLLRMQYVAPLLRFDHDGDAMLSRDEIADINADFGPKFRKNSNFPELLDDSYEEFSYPRMTVDALERAKQSSRWISDPDRLFAILDPDGNEVVSVEELDGAKKRTVEIRKALSE